MKMLQFTSVTNLIALALAFAAFQVVSAFPLLLSGTNLNDADRAAEPRENAPLATVYSSCKNNRQVALTFDDGPFTYAHDITNALDAAGAKGTFFLNGNNYACIYDADEMERVKYIVNHGHQVASHTWSHPHLTTLTFDQIHNELWRIEQALERIVGKTPAFMRPPYGEYNDLVRQVVKQRGQSVAMWDFDSQDSLGATVSQSEKHYRDAVAKNPPNMLALNHEPYETTAHQVLPYAIKLLQSKGYQLVTLAECLNLPAYQKETAPGVPDSTWHC
jgi:peptidoglycan/xylan/chitin deacetylase (PgdA/CDA1 family)